MFHGVPHCVRTFDIEDFDVAAGNSCCSSCGIMLGQTLVKMHETRIQPNNDRHGAVFTADSHRRQQSSWSEAVLCQGGQDLSIALENRPRNNLK
jgi:hypothetical protein